jgi:uncharacterized protein YbjT (DUF2867 family)
VTGTACVIVRNAAVNIDEEQGNGQEDFAGRCHWSGLVGQGVLRVLLQSDQVESVSVLVRRPLEKGDPRLRVLRVADFSMQALAGVDLHGLDACLYCAGPMPLGMTEPDYREATVATVERVVAAFAAANPAGYVAYISGMGADPDSALMPLRVKGQAELVLARSGLAHTNVRPGVVCPMHGAASPHRLRRSLYTLGDPVLALAVGIFPRVFTTTEAIGQRLLRLAIDPRQRSEVIENADIAQHTG